MGDTGLGEWIGLVNACDDAPGESGIGVVDDDGATGAVLTGGRGAVGGVGLGGTGDGDAGVPAARDGGDPSGFKQCVHCGPLWKLRLPQAG